MPTQAHLTTASYSLLFFIATLVFAAVSLCFLKNYLRLGLGPSIWVSVIGLIGGITVGLVTFANGRDLSLALRIDPEHVWTVSAGRGFLVFFALPLLARTYCLLMNPAERFPGAAQARGWLRILDWAYALFITVSAHLGFGIPILLSVGALALIILLPQLVNTLMNQTSSPSSSPLPENLSAEKAKVLSLLEQGKITVEESADLLAALGAARNAPAGAGAPSNISQRLTVIGAVLIVAGFFLPWFSINPLREMERLASQFPNMMGEPGAFAASPSMNPNPGQAFFGTIHVSPDRQRSWLDDPVPGPRGSRDSFLLSRTAAGNVLARSFGRRSAHASLPVQRGFPQHQHRLPDGDAGIRPGNRRQPEIRPIFKIRRSRSAPGSGLNLFFGPVNSS